MKYTEQQRKALYAAFKAAESYLEKQVFLCWALESAYTAGKITESQQDLAKNLIEHRIHPHFAVGRWLHSSVGVPNKELTPTTMSAYRKRWLESLVKEFSK